MFKNRKKLEKAMMIFSIIFILSMLAFTLLPLIIARQLNPSSANPTIPVNGNQEELAPTLSPPAGEKQSPSPNPS